MGTNHTIEDGEHLSSIAAKFGFADFKTIWNDPGNEELRQRVADPHVLLPGDVVFIPDTKLGVAQRPTGQTHVFFLKASKLLLQLRVQDFDNQPIANTECVLEIDGQIFNLRTDGQGNIQQKIARTAVGGTLKLPDLDYEFPVKIGYLNPVDDETGWRARLTNLGYHLGPLDSSDKLLLQYAIEEFQCDHKLKVTGVMDDATKAKLEDEHGA
jgi:N-acetylmuramoyl-L-alanine amidase